MHGIHILAFPKSLSILTKYYFNICGLQTQTHAWADHPHLSNCVNSSLHSLKLKYPIHLLSITT